MQQVFRQLMGAQRLLRETLAAALQGARKPADAAAGASATQLIPVDLCDTRVSIAVRRAGVGGLTYVNLHQNEQTSVKAARQVLEHHPGTLIELRAQRRRYVTFWNGLRPHAFDPNRIFSDGGLRLTLSRYASLSGAAIDAVTGLRSALLARLDVAAASGPVVALHNNAGRDYDVHAYASGGRHAHDASRVAIAPHGRSQNFFLVTEPALFEQLAAQDFHVVLQHPNAADDGSLAVWFQRQARAYVNVEAGFDQLPEQRRMLEVLAGLCG